jgi:hypothetical protein
MVLEAISPRAVAAVRLGLGKAPYRFGGRLRKCQTEMPIDRVHGAKRVRHHIQVVHMADRCIQPDVMGELFGVELRPHNRFAGAKILRQRWQAHIRRLEGICAAAGVALPNLDIQVITAPSLRLDLEIDRTRLEETVARLKPRLLVLDPFVRLHRIDENVSGDVAPLLAFLRELQRRYAVAVAVVHHARKGAGAIRAGQALRGSSEFHAWGDSNLYLRRDGDDRIVLTVEHRAAAAIAGITLELAQSDDVVALQTVKADAHPKRQSS